MRRVRERLGVQTENFVTEDKPVICAGTAPLQRTAVGVKVNARVFTAWRGTAVFPLSSARSQSDQSNNGAGAAARQTSGGGPNHPIAHLNRWKESQHCSTGMHRHPFSREH
jgi:hypothetical protein